MIQALDNTEFGTSEIHFVESQFMHEQPSTQQQNSEVQEEDKAKQNP